MAGVDAQPLADQTAHGQATEVCPLDLQRIEQRQDVMPQLLDAVRTRCHQRATMAAGVVTQYPKVLGKYRYLGVPHPQISPQRVGQHQYLRIGRAIQLVMQFTFGKSYETHGYPLQVKTQRIDARP